MDVEKDYVMVGSSVLSLGDMGSCDVARVKSTLLGSECVCPSTAVEYDLYVSFSPVLG